MDTEKHELFPVESRYIPSEWRGSKVLVDVVDGTILQTITEFSGMLGITESNVYKGINNFLDLSDLGRNEVLESLSSGEYYRLEPLLFVGLRSEFYSEGVKNEKAIAFMWWALARLAETASDEVLRKRIKDLENRMTFDAETNGTNCANIKKDINEDQD